MVYWLIGGECDVDGWRDIQDRLIAHFDGDASIKNPSRVMRLPFFNHVHYDKESAALSYKRVALVEFAPEHRYTLEDMRAAFAPVYRQPPESSIKEATPGASEFATWEELHAEAARRISFSPKDISSRLITFNRPSNAALQRLAHSPFQRGPPPASPQQALVMCVTN